MSMSGVAARPMMAGIFVYGGLDALRDPEGKAKAADHVAPMIAEALHLPINDTITLVRVNGGIQVVAGTLLALGKARRISALALAASLVPTTYAGHRFWEELDEERRAHQRIQFLKNLAMLGGLIIAAADTGGRPSVPWQARRAARHAAEIAGSAGLATEEAAKQVQEITRDAQKAVAAQLSRNARKATKKAHQADLAALVSQARQMAKAAQHSDITTRALKAAGKTATKAKEADIPRRARKAAQKVDAARPAAWAAEAARQAGREVKQVPLAPYAGAAVAKVQQVSGDALERARELARDGSVGQARESAATAVQQLASRAKDALPVG